MARVTFLPSGQFSEVDLNTKLLIAGKRASVEIRFGCASCRCGTCGVKVLAGDEHLSPMKPDEAKLLNRMKLDSNGTIRLACQARIHGDCTIDLDFQDSYDPEKATFLDDDEENS